MAGFFGSTIPVLGMNLGFLGQFSRGASGDRFIVSKQANTANVKNIAFGDVCVVIPDSAGGTYRNVADFIAQGGTFTAARFAGIANREVKTNLIYSALSGNGPINFYAPGERTEVGVKGSVTVQVLVGTPVQGNPIYVRTALNGSIAAGVIGGIEAVADGSNSVQIPGVVFKTGQIDGNFVSEITLLNRVAA